MRSALRWWRWIGARIRPAQTAAPVVSVAPVLAAPVISVAPVLALAVLALLRPLFGAESAAPTAATKCPAPEAVDDRRIVQRLEKEGADLIAAGRTTKMAALIEQLKTKKCSLSIAAPGTERIAQEAFYERLRPSVLIVSGIYKCEKCSKWHAAPAGGYPLTATGACVTNHHVLNNPKWETLIAMTADGRMLPVKAVLAASSADDVAIVQLDGEGLTPVALAPDAPVGAHVRVIHHPDGRFYTLTEGVIARYFATRRPGGNATMMSITADYAKGSSGAPVFDDRGAVVGMVADTVSIYYDEKAGHKDNLQMVIKECVPAANVLKLIEKR